MRDPAVTQQRLGRPARRNEPQRRPRRPHAEDGGENGPEHYATFVHVAACTPAFVVRRRLPGCPRLRSPPIRMPFRAMTGRRESPSCSTSFILTPTWCTSLGTTGGRREASQPRKAETADDLAAAAKRLALMESLPEVKETGLFDTTRFGEGTYGGPEDQERLNKIRAALWPDKKAPPDLSERNDALSLDTLLKCGRDHFVTTDKRILEASDRLNVLRIHVLTPSEAATLARSICATKAGSG